MHDESAGGEIPAVSSQLNAAHACSWRKWMLLAILCALLFENAYHALPLMIRYGMKGWADFSTFYVGANILRHGLGRHLYDLSLQARFQPVQGVQALPYIHPAYELLLFLPLAGLAFPVAFWLWNGINVVMLVVSARSLAVQLKSLSAVWVMLAALAFFPVAISFKQSQDSILTLLIFTLVYGCLRYQREVLAGVLLSAGLFKFPLVLPFFLPWLFRGRWRFVAGFFSGGLLLAGVSVALIGISASGDYVRLLFFFLRHPEVGYIYPRWMPTIHGLFAVIAPGADNQLAAIASGVLSLFLLALSSLRWCDVQQGSRFDLWFAMNICAAVLASPNLYPHDLTVILLALLLANRAMQTHGFIQTYSVDESFAPSLRGTCVVISAIFFCTPLYLYLQNKDWLGLLALPLLA